MNIKKMTTLLSGLVVLFGTTTAFSIWDSLEDSEANNIIQLGQGTGISASTTVSVSDWIPNQQLVPSGVVQQSGDVTSASTEFDVEFTGTLSAALELDVNYTNLNIGVISSSSFSGVNTFNSLVVITMKWSYTSGDYSTSPTGTYTDNFLTHADADLPDFYDSTGPSTRANIYIQVTVTINEPQYSSDYLGIAGKNISFDLNFKAAA